MKQFKTILNFELKYYFKNKVFVGITIFLMLLIGAVMFYPRVSALFEKEETTTEAETIPDDLPIMLISADSEESTEQILAFFTPAFTEYKLQPAVDGLKTIKDQVMSGEADCAFVFHDLKSYTYYVNTLTMTDSNTAIADEVLQNIYRINAMTEKGISMEDASEILSMQISHETENLGKNQVKNFFYTYIMIFALYMVILLYGQMVATNVATEKSSRAMEVLITSAKPTSMMFGKVIASCIAGFIQLVCVFGSAFLCFNLNKTYWESNMMINSIFNMPIELLLYMLLFFVLGFVIYAFMFGAVGSTASKLEDINTSVMPITLLFVIAFLVVMFSMSSGNVDNTLMMICSFIPFTSPMAMFTRIAMSTVPVYQILLSIGILIVSTIGVGVLSAKIYRVGVLLYGTTPKIGSIIKAVFSSEK